jgi:hypothetical protein
MKKILAIAAPIVLFAANAFAGLPIPMEVTTVPTLSEWGTVGAVVVLGFVGVFFLIRRKKRGCCS